MSPRTKRRLSGMTRRAWCRVRVVGDDGVELAGTTLLVARAADLDLVDIVARLALSARRAGAALVVEDADDALYELLALAALPVEVCREPERREEALGLEEREEEGHLGDPP